MMDWEKRKIISCVIFYIIFCNQVSLQEHNEMTLHYRSNINHRYAVTWVTANMFNPNNYTEELFFQMTLPKTAFISGLIMEVGGVNYTSLVKNKEEIPRYLTYNLRRHAAFVEQSDSSEQTLNVRTYPNANSTVIFYLKYEELLLRNRGKYTQNILINPRGVGVMLHNKLDIVVNIQENEDIKSVDVIAWPHGVNHTDIKIDTTNSKAPVVSYESVGSEGLHGELTLIYDVKREYDAGEIQVSGDYFVHFFAPDALPKMDAHTVFILDVSGSMEGEALDQLKMAMLNILFYDHESEDTYELLSFNDTVKELGDHVYNASLVFPALHEIYKLTAEGGTNMYDALRTGLSKVLRRDQHSVDQIMELTDFGNTRDRHYCEFLDFVRRQSLANRLRELIAQNCIDSENVLNKIQHSANQIVFLTDGIPTSGDLNTTSAILSYVKRTNTANIPIYSIALGDNVKRTNTAKKLTYTITLGSGPGPDYKFLRKLSYQNQGFAQNIPVNSNLHEIMREFFQEIGTPLMADINIKYPGNDVDTNSRVQKGLTTLHEGNEIVVAAKLNPGANGSLDTEIYGFIDTGFHEFKVAGLYNTTQYSEEENLIERLWAYLTIQDLLNKANLTDDTQKVKDLKSQVISLSLKYKFVTKLTSLEMPQNLPMDDYYYDY